MQRNRKITHVGLWKITKWKSKGLNSYVVNGELGKKSKYYFLIKFQQWILLFLYQPDNKNFYMIQLYLEMEHVITLRKRHIL